MQASLIIGAKLDTDPHGEACRLAFYGRLVALLCAGDMEGPGCQLQKLRVHKVSTHWLAAVSVHLGVYLCECELRMQRWTCGAAAGHGLVCAHSRIQVSGR